MCHINIRGRRSRSSVRRHETESLNVQILDYHSNLGAKYSSLSKFMPWTCRKQGFEVPPAGSRDWLFCRNIDEAELQRWRDLSTTSMTETTRQHLTSNHS